MIILFDTTPDELARASSDQTESAVIELVGAFRRGDHVVIIPRESIRELIKLAWSPLVKATLSNLARDAIQSTDLLRRASCVLCVRTSATVDRPTQANFTVITVSDFLQERLYLPGILLVENATRDGALFTMIIREMGRRSGAGAVHVEPSHGGGGDIVNAFEYQISLKKYIVCVIDSDRITPFCKYKPTERKLDKVKLDSNWKFAKIITLKCHEIENILHPMTILSLDCAQEYRGKAIVDRILDHEVELFGEDSIWLYLDLKNGINSAKLSTLDPEEAAWIGRKVVSIGLDKDNFDIPGFGTSVIDLFLSHELKYDFISKNMIANKSWVQTFQLTFEEIMWYFVGRNRICT